MNRESRRMTVWWALIALAVVAALVGFFCLRSAPPPEPEAVTTAARTGVQQRDPRLVRRHLRQLALALGRATQELVRVSGTVRSSDDGQPIPEARITLEGVLGGRFEGITDDQGHYVLKVPAGLYRALARADGYVPVGSVGFPRHPRPPQAEDAGEPLLDAAPLLELSEPRDGVDLELRGGAAISGVVLDPLGDPVAGAVVAGRLFGWEGRFTRLVSGADTALSGQDGSFRIEVPAGPVELAASHPDFAGIADDSSSLVHASPGDERQVELTLVKGCIIEGRVVDQGGMPIASGAIEAWTGRAFPNSYEPAGTFDNGRFRYTRTGGGPLRLKAWPWKSTHSEPQDFECADGAVFDDVLFVIPPAEPELSGVVVDADGQPVPEAFLDLLPLDHDGLSQQERADASGEFAFFSQPPGRHVLSAHVPGEGVAAIEVAVPARGVRLQLGGTGGIEGRVRGLMSGSFTFTVDHCLAGGAGGDWPVVGLRTAAASSLLVHVDGGSFFIDDLPACTLQAVVRTPQREQRVSVQVRADREASLELDLSAPVVTTVHGTAYDADGRPAPHTDVRRELGLTEQPRFPLPAFAETDGDGRFEIDAHAGDTLVFFGPRGQATLAVGAGDGARRQRVDVSLSPLPPVHPRADFESLLADPHAIIDW